MLEISPISFLNMPKVQKIKPQISFAGNCDTFTRTTSPVGDRNNDFIEWAEKTGFTAVNLKEILSNEENKLGKGFTHSAYLIPNNNQYVIRTGNVDFSKIDFENIEIKDEEEKDLKVNIGQQVAAINVYEKGSKGFPYKLEVLKKQEGTPIGVPPATVVYIENSDGILKDGELPYEDISRKEKYAKTLHAVANLPISAYEKLIDTLAEVKKSGYELDHLNSNNLFVDEENKSINLIDMEKKPFEINFGNALYALSNIYYLSTFTSSLDDAPMSEEKIKKAYDDTLTVIDKFLNAMKNKGVKFNRRNYSYEFDTLFQSIPFSIYFKTFNDEEKWQKLVEMGVAE